MPDLGSSQALDVAIGLILVYFIFALLCSGINELIARIFSLRARFLEKGLRNLLDDRKGGADASGLAEKILENPLIRGLQRGGAPSDPKNAKPPSYIPSDSFALALFDTIAPSPSEDTKVSHDVIAAAGAAVKDVKSEHVRRSLTPLLEDARGDRDAFRANIEKWYDNSMDRVQGWYKRRVQTILLVIGVALAIAFNVDSFQIGNTLWNDKSVRAAVVTEADQVAKSSQKHGEPEQQLKDAASRVSKVEQLKLPIGWSDANGDPRHVPSDAGGWLAKILGWIVTGLALSLGAPFWFDLLGKATSLRSTGKRETPSAN